MKKVNIVYLIITLFIYLSLTACGGGGGGSEANVDVTIDPSAAISSIVADAGPDQDGSTNTIIRLGGTNSSGEEGATLSFTWSFDQKPANSTVTFSDPFAINPTFQPDLDGTYVIKLVVSDGTDSVEAFITVRTSSPVADAGGNQTVSVGSTVSLDGSASADGSGLLLNYLWEISLQPEGSTATIPIPAITSPTFVPDISGTYVISLIVNNGLIDSISDTITITAVPPTANAGPDQAISTSSLVTLDGSASSDFSGLPLEYSWLILSQPVGSTTDLLVNTVVNPTFIPDTDGVYVIGLIVTNGTEASIEDTVNIVSGTKPVAIAGPDQTVSVGETVMLDGSQSNTANGSALTYSWGFTSAPASSNAFLSNYTSDNASFEPDLAGEYTISLLVNNGSEQSDPDTLIVTTSLPVADGGGDQNVEIGSLVQLNSNFSSDPNGYGLTSSWQILMLPVGSSTVLSNTATELPTFTADLDGEYLIELVVNNGFVDSDPVIVTVTARPSVGDASGIFSTSFEGTSGDAWSVSNGVWEIGQPTSGPGIPYVGGKVAATVLAGDYPNTNSSLISPSVNLPTLMAGEEIHLRFWQWFNITLAAFYSPDSGSVSIQEEISLGVWGIGVTVDATTQLITYVGSSGGVWTRPLVNLSSYSGKKVRLLFGINQGGAYSTGLSPGWYIDELIIEKVIP